jgi:hypothetical protein
MSDWLMRVIKAEAERLVELAGEDDELRADLRALAESILAATAATQPSIDTTESTSTSEAPPADDEPTAAPLKELTLGRLSLSRSNSSSVSAAMNWPKTEADDLTAIEARCRRKCEAARWAAERVRQAREGNSLPVENPAMEPEMVEWADRLTNCFYWMQSSQDSLPADLSLVDDVGGCFGAVAEALALVRVMLEQHPGNPKVLERSLPFVAEAQSALKGAFQRLEAAADPDQLDVFEWLKVTAARNHVYIKRFMRADETASPAGWYDLLARIESAGTSGKQPRLSDSQVGRIRDRLKHVQGGAGASHDDDWRALITVVDGIVGEGVPPSNREIRDLLLPVIDELPAWDEYPDGFRLVLREIDRFLGTRPAPARSPVSHESSAEVKEAGGLLGGTSIVLIGGNRRREAQEALRRALALKDLIWIETKEHQAVDTFEPLIARADVALVLLAIRWSSHAFGDVKQLCERHGKLLVRLPGGYNPNQVAAQVLLQSSAQLSSDLGRGAVHAGPRVRLASGLEPG